MSDPTQIYADNVGHTHAAACQAVYDAGVYDGVQQAAAAFLAAPTPQAVDVPALAPQVPSAAGQ